MCGQLNLKGTYSIAAICKDGVVLSADSRGAFLRADTSIAYFDSIQKVFVVRNCLLSVVGLIALGDRFVTDYVTEFEKTLNKDISPDSCIISFMTYLSQFPKIKDDLSGLNILTAGYKNGQPAICYIVAKTGSGQCAIDSGIALQDKKINFGKGTIYDEKYCLNHTCKEVSNVIEKAILDYAKKENKTSSIGGKVSIVSILKNKKIVWVKNMPIRQRWKTTKEFISDYNSGKVKVTFVSSDARGYLKRNLNLTN
jgi:20S proteasome alpha/beta subunit